MHINMKKRMSIREENIKLKSFSHSMGKIHQWRSIFQKIVDPNWPEVVERKEEYCEDWFEVNNECERMSCITNFIIEVF